MNVLIYSIYAKLKLCKHPYIVDNIDKHFLQLVGELKHQVTLGNEITLSKMIGKDAVQLLKLIP